MPELAARFNLREMTRDERCNVEALSEAEANRLFAEIKTLPAKQHRTETGAVFNTYNWKPNDVRWTLTPHELRKYEHRKVELGAM
jgi:hypothetical protein